VGLQARLMSQAMRPNAGAGIPILSVLV
jgi:hypothetical protein